MQNLNKQHFYKAIKQKVIISIYRAVNCLELGLGVQKLIILHALTYHTLQEVDPLN